MSSKLLTNDQQNFVHLGIAVVDKIKLPIKDLLEMYIKPVDLYNAINSCTVLLTGKHKLNADQRKICYLPSPDVPDYGKFDVTLLCKLIQNLCPQLVPTQGWGKEPGVTDVKIGDDIERLRQFRNDMFGHLESTSIPYGLFKSRWKELGDIMKRMYTFLSYQGINVVNYEIELADVRRHDFGFEDMEKYKILLEATLSILKHTQIEELPTIAIRGDISIICGETSCFEADIDQRSTSTHNWPFTWHRVRGNHSEQIDTSTEKYTDSTSRRLVIQRVSKEDQGDYQAIISGNSKGQHIKIPSNVMTMVVTGERPVLQQLEVTSGKDGISLHYKYEVSQNSPKVHHIAWTKNDEVLSIDHEKYVGGDVTDSSLTIRSPSVQDSGKYSCIIANAVGAVSESLILGVPKATVLAESIFYGDDTHINSVISSCPPAERAVREKSHDSVIFEQINVRERKYSNSTLDPSNPVLKLTTATFDDKLHYRLRIWNSIGESVSNTIFLNVTGDPPNISIVHETNINSCSVVLTCNIFLYDRSPPITQIEWQKDGNVINITESGGKYTGGTVVEPSLVIINVNESDAGSYRCKASNAVGSTFGNAILLGVPEIKIQGPKLTGNGRYIFTALLESTPIPIRAQWSIKNDINDDYSPIDIYCQEYKGTSNNLPQPVLCLSQISLENQHFQLEVQNLIGTTAKKMPDERSSYTTEKMHDTKDDRLTAIINKRGSSIRFNDLCLDLIKEVSERDLNILKFSLNVMTSMALPTENVTTVQDLFTFLIKEGIFKERNVIMIQYLMRRLKRQDLELKCVEYAIKDKQALCYFEETKLLGPNNKDIEAKSSYESQVRNVLAGPCSNLFRRVLRKYVLEEEFTSRIERSKTQLLPLLNVEQQSVLYPERGSFSGSYKHLDMPLMYILFQRICFIEPHKQGWGNSPDQSDSSLAACIERIMEIQREYCGDTPPFLGQSDFDRILKRILQLSGNIEEALESPRKDTDGKEKDKELEEQMEGRFEKEENFLEKLRDMSISLCLSPTVVSTSSITIPRIHSVFHISCVTADRLWVNGDRHLLQIDSCGDEILKERIENDMYPVGSHTVTKDGELLFIDRNHIRVQKMTSDGTITTLIQTEGERLCSIHSSHINGNILVGYINGIMRYDRTGQRIRDFMEDWRHGIYYPMYITENRNGDIWFSDDINRAVVVADKSGRHQFNYTGQKSQSPFFHGFHPFGVCADILGHILVCDMYNPSVHLLDQDGQFLCLLLTEEQGLHRPMALCVDDKHNLYLGQEGSNTITVYNYLQETEKNTPLMESK